MIEAIISGKAYGKPAQRTSKTGAAFTVAKLRVATSASESLFVNVIAFSDSAQAALLALDDGDAAALAGTLTPKVWTDRDGITWPALDLVQCCILDGTFKTDAFGRVVRRKPQRYRGIARICNDTAGTKARF